MDANHYYKAQNILVTGNGDGLKLINPDTKKTIYLGSQQAEIWINYDEHLLFKAKDKLLEDLYCGGFIIKKENHMETYNNGFSNEIPIISGKDVKWNIESPDLYILFNSKPSHTEKPFIIFGPYGSMCWKKIVEGYSIREICDIVQKIFGDCDKVIPILKGLIEHEFIKKIKGIELEEPCGDISELTVSGLLAHIPHINTPWYTSWEICSACNLRCKHCYLTDYSNLGLSTDKVKHIVNQLVESGIFHVIIMGGEPLLRADLEDIVRSLRKGGIYVSIITNGQLLTVERARSLVESGVEMLYISFDGFDKDTHEMIRGHGTFGKSIEAIDNARQAGIPRIAVSWAINDMNMQEYSKLPDFLNLLNVSECYMELFKKTGLYGSKAPFNTIGIKEVGILKEAIGKWKNEHPSMNISLNTQCSCGRTRMKIGDNGDVFICPYLDESMGNLLNDTLNNIWQSMESKIPPKGPAGFCKSVRELYLLHMYG